MEKTIQLYRLNECVHKVYAVAGAGFKYHDRKAVAIHEDLCPIWARARSAAKIK